MKILRILLLSLALFGVMGGAGYYFGVHNNLISVYYGSKYKPTDCVHDGTGNVMQVGAIVENEGKKYYIMQVVAANHPMIVMAAIMSGNKLPMEMDSIDSIAEISRTECPEAPKN